MSFTISRSLLPTKPIELVYKDSEGKQFNFKHGPPPAVSQPRRLLGWRMRTINIGCANRPFYLLVIHRQREDKGDEYTEQLGSYDPLPNRYGELLIGFNIDRIRYWLGKGAEPTKSVRELLGLAGILPVFPRSYLTAYRNRLNKQDSKEDIEEPADCNDVSSKIEQQERKTRKTMKEAIKVLITGAGGQIGYSLVYMVTSGYVFGNDQPIDLHLLEIPYGMKSLQGLCMELQDSYLPLIHSIINTDNLEEGFKDIDVAFLVGSVPRKQGMERKDLMSANVKIFEKQGQALDKYAKKTVKVIVVGNPANTNAYICSKFAPSIPSQNITAMTRLDQNRCYGMLADALKVNVSSIKNAIVWGNHSTTMFPDTSQATVTLPDGKTLPVDDKLSDKKEWLRTMFVKSIQTRGSAIIEARKLSSALSAAKAACDHMKDWWNGTEQYASMVVQSDGSYGVEKGLFFSFPCTIKNKEWQIVQGIQFDSWAQSMIDATMKELIEEKEMALHSIA
ncbi:hypothetical protein GJ496_001030 [Pomphorhynchus laevis]|nr:hypothetical protein GJ496_001030 [Pomphorhynchus laevis]